MMRRVLKVEVVHLPVDRVTRGILAEPGYEQCADQTEHLKKQDGKWLWESCSACLRDRQLILNKLSEFGIGAGFPALFGFGSASEPNATHSETALPIGHHGDMGSTA